MGMNTKMPRIKSVGSKYRNPSAAAFAFLFLIFFLFAAEIVRGADSIGCDWLINYSMILSVEELWNSNGKWVRREYSKKALMFKFCFYI